MADGAETPSGWPAREHGEVRRRGHFEARGFVERDRGGGRRAGLLQGLLADGHVRLFRNGGFHPGGIEIDRHHNWISENGSVIENAWALGIPTEGIKFCTFVVPRPGVNSTALVDAGRAVAALLASVRKGQDEVSCNPAGFLPTEAEASAYASLYGMP